VIPVSGSVAALCERIYNGYGRSDKVGIPYFLEFHHELPRQNAIEFLAFNFREYPYVYSSELMLGTPFVWADFTSQEWVALLRAGSPRPNSLRLIEEISSFCDLEFLVKYLRLNALNVYAADPLISDLDKMNAIGYFKRFSYLLEPEVDDLLDGVSLIGIKEIERIRSRLVDEGVFSPLVD